MREQQRIYVNYQVAGALEIIAMMSIRKFALGCLPLIAVAGVWLASAVQRARHAAMKTTDK